MAGPRPAQPGPSAPLPRPLPVPPGEAAFGLRRGRWLVRVLLALALLAASVMLSHQALQRAWPWAIAGLALLAAAVTAWLSGLLAQAMAAQRAGSVLRLDADGIHHCQLPLLAWRDVHGVDLCERAAPSGAHWALELGVAAPAASVMKLPAWRFWLDASLPRVEAAGRLSIPLSSVDVEPRQLAGAARGLADRWGVPTQQAAAKQAADLLQRLRATGATP